MISFHNHTDYSNLRGADCILTVKQLVAESFKQGHTGVAITDHGLLSGIIKFRKEIKALQERGAEWLAKEPNNPDALRMANFTGALGYEAYIAKEGMDADTWQKGDKFRHLVLVAKNRKGLEQLNQLCTMAWRRQFKRAVVRIPNYFSDLEKVIGTESGNVICTTACLAGPLAHKVLEFAETKSEELKNSIISDINK